MDPSVHMSEPPLPAERISPPGFAMPADACDAHMHVFGSASAYHAQPDARYTLPDATAADYRGTATALGLRRAVLVQPSYYGADNACLLDALDADPAQRRGVVIAADDVGPGELAAWHARGVRGLRLDFFKQRASGSPLARQQDVLLRTCERAARLGWSVDLYIPGATCWQMARSFERLPCPVSIAHMGYLTPMEGITDTQCQEFVALVRGAPVWPKLSGAYRYGPGLGQARAKWLTSALIAAAPDRVLWGSDWPHVMSPPQDGGALLRHALAACDATVAADILVHNPARLYGFD